MVASVGCQRGEKQLIEWNESENTHVRGGVKNTTAFSVQECQRACILNSSCDGLDWNPHQNEGSRCWLHGPWSGRRVEGSANGITHYDINRTGICISRLFFFQKLLLTSKNAWQWYSIVIVCLNVLSRRVVAAVHVLCCCEFLRSYVGSIACCWLFLSPGLAAAPTRTMNSASTILRALFKGHFHYGCAALR